MARRDSSLKAWCQKNGHMELLQELANEINSDHFYGDYTEIIEYNSSRSLSWKCENGHIWEGPVAARTLFGRSCPVCNPQMKTLPVGTRYGCLTIIGNEGEDKLNEPIYLCRCKCGLTHLMPEYYFLEKKHRYCTDVYGTKTYWTEKSDKVSLCGLLLQHEAKLRETYKRVYERDYDKDFTNTVHESLNILECIDDQHEETRITDKRKKGGGYIHISKIYRCKCYLCGQEYHFSSAEFGINSYGGPYDSSAKCHCHKHSSFQWIVNKLLKENNVPYRVEESFPDLYGASESWPLRFDFAILNPDGTIKSLVECQGEQHSKAVAAFGGEEQFEIQKKYDEMKREYAAEHGIPLLEIKNKDRKYAKVEEILKKQGIIASI